MPTSLDLKALRVFLAVADKGNMTSAAKVLGITQSAVSQVVRQVEAAVGVPLVDRSRRPLRLTAAGAVMARRAAHSVAEIEQLVAVTREVTTVPELRVGLIDAFAGTVGLHVARMFMEKVDSLMLWSGLTVRLWEDFLNRRLDLVVCAEAIEGVAGLRQVLLFSEPFILVLPKAVLGDAQPKSLEALPPSLPIVRYSARSHAGTQIDRHFRRIGYRPSRRLEMDTSETVFAMVAEGIGWAITTPLCIVQGRPDLRRIRFAPLPGVGFSRQVVLIHRRGEYDAIADSVADITWTTMSEQIIPAIHKVAPFAAHQIVLNRQDHAKFSAVLPLEQIGAKGT